MSECVVRMEMPENCFKCPFSIFGETGVWCNAIANNVYGYVERDEDCPIVFALPEGHGRLVDADAMADDVRILWDYKTVDGITASTVLKQIMTDIGNCPTIVPAERSET